MKALALAALVTLSACFATNPMTVGSGTAVSTDFVPVHWAVQEVFERAAIPVEEVDEQSGSVRSGTFTVSQTWDGDPLARRLACRATGATSGASLYASPLTVSVAADVRPVGETEARVHVSGEAVGEGRTDGSQVRCALRESFREWLMEEVRRKAENLPQGPRTY